MNTMNLDAVLCIGVAIILSILALALILRRYLEVSMGKAILIWLLSVAAGVAAGMLRLEQLTDFPPIGTQAGNMANGWEPRWQQRVHWLDSGHTRAVICAGLLTALAVVFLVKLYSKWIAARLTDAEKKPGMDGVRAWLGTGNIVCVILISLLAWQGLDYSPGGVAMLGLLALLAYPLMNFASVYFQAPPPSESHAAERQRVLNMLDSGKITASEGAELLGALNFSEKPRTSKAVAAPSQKLAVVGVLLLLIGFFLPWFSLNPQSEIHRMVQGLPNDPNWAQHFPPGMLPTTDTIRIAGGDIQHGLGWLVLALGVAAAALPYFAGNLDEQTRHRTILASLCAGAVILIYLMTQNLRFVSIGIFLAVIGYGLQLAGALRGVKDNILPSHN
jgi:hypothetical protein